VKAHRLRAIFWKEFIQMRRDRGTLGLLLVIPMAQVLLFGYAIRMDVRNLRTAVLDGSRTAESRELAQRLEATGNFRIVSHVESYADALELLDRGAVRAAFVIPPEYARSLKRDRPVAVQVLVDATDPTASQNAIAAAQMVGQQVNFGLVANRLGIDATRGSPPLEVRVRPLYNPALRSAMFIVPGIIGMILSLTLMIVTSLAIVRERERGTLEQLIVTPLTRGEIMLGKIAPYVLVGYVQISAVLLIGWLVFHVPIRGSLWLIYAESMLFIIGNLGLGLFISTLARTQAQAMQVSYFFVMPNILLSGFMFPREGMPLIPQKIGLAFPLTYYLQVLRGIVLKGVGVQELWPQTLALLGFALLYFTFSVRRFRKSLE
jgi:ABC-2 type transport system permease protein